MLDVIITDSFIPLEDFTEILYAETAPYESL